MTPEILTGALAGILHVVVSPDHLAVLAPFSIEARRGAWRVGLRWGIGDATGLLCVAIAAYLARDALDPARLRGLGEPLIGVILIGVGIWGLRHLRPGGRRPVDAAEPVPRHVHTRAALALGTLQGVAGTGGLLGVVPVLGLPTWLDAGAYLAGFSAGTLGGMVAAATLLGRLGWGEGDAGQRIRRRVFLTASGVALVVGVAWIVLPALGFDLHAHPGPDPG